MPKKLTKLLKLSGKKKGDGDNASISSKASIQAPSELSAIQIFSYTIKKDKDLPKLHKASWQGNVIKVKELAKLSSKPGTINEQDKKNRTPLHLACAQGDANIATHLLSCKAKVNLRDLDGRTPLMKAVDSNQCGCAKVLLDANSDANIADNDGLTPLHVTAHRGMKDIAILLLERDARLSAIDKSGSSPLHYATLQGHNDFVSFLINEGANVNATDGKGHTPLMLAAAEGRIGILKILLQGRPNAELKDDNGCTATDHAIINNNNNIVQLINDYQRSTVQSSKPLGRPNSMLIKDPKLALSGSNFRGPAVDDTDDLNDTKTDDTSAKIDVASHNSWNSNDEEDSSQALPASNRGPNLSGALKLVNRQDCNLVQATKGHSSTSRQSTALSEGNPLISKPILHSTSKPLAAFTYQQQQQQQILPTGRKASEQFVDDYQLDSFDDSDSDSESDVEEKPMAKVVNSTPNVLDKKLPGLSFSFDKPPFSSQVIAAGEKEEPQAPDSKVLATPVASHKQVPTMATPKQTKALATEKVNAEKGDISSDFDSSPPLSEAEDDQLNKQFSSNCDDDIPTTAYVPSVGSSLTRQSNRNPLTGPLQQLTIKEKEKEEDKILELAHSSFLEVDGTSKHDLTCKNSDTVDSVDTGSPSCNIGTFSPITPLTDQVDGPSMFPTDVKPTIKKAMKSSGITVGIMSSLSESSSSLNTDSVIRQAEEIEQSIENRDHEVQGKLKSVATIGCEKTDKQETEGSDWDSEGVDDEDDNTTPQSDSKDEGHNALAGLGTYGLPDLSDPFTTHSKHGSKPPSKPGDYFNMYKSDSSEADDDIEKLLSPEKNVEKHSKSLTSNREMKTDTQAIQDNYTLVNTNTVGNSTNMEHHSSPTSKNIRKQHDDFVDKGNEMEFVNALLDDKDDDNDHATTEESESEWEKELKQDQKRVNQSSLVTLNQQTILKVDQKQATSVNDKQLCPTDNNEALTNNPPHSDGKDQILLANNKATRSLNNNTNIQQSELGDEHPSPSSTKEASSPLPISPSTMKDMQATERYQQKENELLLVLEGRRKQLENTKATVNPPVKISTRIDEELAHVKRPSIKELRNTWEGQEQVNCDMSPPLDYKSTDKVELEPMKSSPRSSLAIDNFHHLLDKKNDAANVVVISSEDQALFEQSIPAKALESNEVLFSEEEEEEEEENDSLPENVNKPSTMADTTSQMPVKSLGLEKLTGAVEEKQQSLPSPLENSEESFSSDKSVEEQYKSPALAAAEETEQDRQLQQETGKVVEAQEDEQQHISNPSSDVLASYQSDQRTTPIDEGIADHKHPMDNSDDMLLNRSISLSSQHTTTDLSTTHNAVSPIPFLASSVSQRNALTAYSRPTSSLLESSGVSALQENLRKTQRELERAQSAEAHAKTGKKRMEAQLKESYRKQSDLTTVKTQLEESKLDLEMANRSMKCQLEQESMARKNAESLVDQFRQQLSKLEQQLRKEKESHQKALSQKKEVELDHRTLLISTQQLQERLDDLQSRLQRERDSWKLQETLYNERLKVFQDIQEESSKNKERQALVLTQLEESDVMRQSLLEKHSSLQQQLAQVQVQLSREQQQHEELQLQLSAELETANSRLTTKSNSLVEAEKALLQLQQQFDSSLTELKSKAEVLSAKLDEEVCNKKRAEAELSAMRSQHDKVNDELQVALKEKLLLEKEQHIKEQESFKKTSLLERDVASSQERLQEMVEKLQSMETKLTSRENENKNLQSRFFEQANQIIAIQRESDHNQQLLAATEEKLRRENELRIKLESQLTSANEKSATNQSELVYLRAQLEVANKSITDKDTLNSESQDKFSSILDSLKADHQQARNSLEEKLQTLRDQLMVAKEEIAGSNLERNSLSKEIIHLKQELEKCTQEKKAMAKILEQTKELSTTNKVSQVDLQHQIEVLNSKLMTSENNCITSQKSCEDLQDQLAEQQQQCNQLQEELALTEQECAAVSEEKIELEESVSTLTEHLEKHQDELSKKDGQIVQLSTQLKHFQDVRSGLEQTTTLLRGEIHELESQLTSMTVECDKALASAEESKGLWETEIKSRSQLGLKLMQLEKSHSDHAVLLDNEKRKARKALEMKKSVDRKMESYQERNALLQEELVSLKNQLKFTKKKVKEAETTESFIKAELNKAQQLLQSETDSLRSQLLKVSTELRTESILRKEADNGVASLKRECERSRSQLSLSKSELREKEKMHRQLEKGNRRLKEELNALKEEVSRKYTPISELEVYKIQVEDQAKRELQAKLEEINSHLEQQSTVQAALDKLRSDTELQWQSRYEQTTEELKFQLKKALSEVEELRVERDNKDAEARRYKELFEVESQRREKLSSKLEMAKEHTEHASALGNLDHRPHHLLDNSLSNSLPRNSQNFPSSSYSHPTPSVPLKNSTNDLLSSVRQELDKSIAKHLDSVSSTTRPQLKYHRPSQLAPQRDAARVTAIAQNYFV